VPTSSTTGYSGKPVAVKLGIVAGKSVATRAAPASFLGLLAPLPAGMSVADAAKARGPFDVIVFFVRELAELRKHIATCERRLDPDGALWVAWPKRASGVTTDVSEDRVREVALPRGLVDNKVCAIDETWSGLRLVVRKENRARGSSAVAKKVKRSRNT